MKTSFRMSDLPAKQSDRLPVERRNIVRFTTRYQITIDHDLPIHPLGAGVMEVCLEGWPGSDPSPTCRSGLDDGPGAVADGGDRLVGIEECFHKSHRLRLHSQG